MGVAVLNPQDCLKDPFSRHNLISPHMKHPRNPNPNRANRNQASRGKRSPSRSQNNSPPARAMVPPRNPSKNLAMGQVKILKRGEELKKTTPDLVVGNDKVMTREVPDLSSAEPPTTPKPEPEPELVLTRTRSVPVSPLYYAGSAFFASPPPSSLPLPAFTKKTVSGNIYDDATSNLIRILRLDLA